MQPNTERALTLLAEHGGRLHALLLRLTLRNDVAEDLMQDLFCKLVQSDAFGTAANPAAYALRMATNLAFDYRRTQRRKLLTELATIEPAATNASPLADLVRREELDRMLDAVGQLPRDNRDLVVLRYLQRQSYEAIGEHFGKTAHQVRAKCHQAIVKLRELLDAEAPNRASARRAQP